MPSPSASASHHPVISRALLVPFILVTSLFALWGFANDITNPMVAAFKDILLISNFESALVQAAFYGGYCFMAIPAALFIKRFSYKTGILMGLILYSLGCILFVPAGNMMEFSAFLAAYFIMTCGLAFLETTANPYILSMGDESTATRRLNFAQAFNPIGSLTGMLIAKQFILAKLDTTADVIKETNPALFRVNIADVAGAAETYRAGMPGDIAKNLLLPEKTDSIRRVLAEANPEAFVAVQKSDLDAIVGPYLILGFVVLAAFFVFALMKFPSVSATAESGHNLNVSSTLKRLFKNPCYIWGVVAQAFYVGVQIMVWTFIIQYAGSELGMSRELASAYNMAAMVMFVSSRFVCTFLLKYIRPSRLLLLLAIGGGIFTLGAIFIQGMLGLYSLVAISACMSLMFPTIYGIALKGLGEDAKLGSAGLILAIGGGCLMPPLQGLLIDKADWFGSALSATRVSFVLPLICFVAIALYALFVRKHRPA